MALQFDKQPEASIGKAHKTGGIRQFVDNRPEAIAQRKMKELLNSSPTVVAQRKIIKHVFGKTIQREALEEEELAQPKFKNTVQRQGPLEEEELPVQGRFKDTVQREGTLKEEELPAQPKFNNTAQLANADEARPNNTGLPDNLKTGIESLSGQSMDDVKVHYQSDKPAQLNAHAYAQGTDIHIAPGQEQHLPHEAWHVVQQKQGRVEPTMQLHDVAINDDSALEKEADTMGARALQV